MGCLLNTVIVFLLVGLTVSSKHTYKAGSVSSRQPLGLDACTQLIQNAAKANVDILVMPTLEDHYPQADNFDEVVKAFSSLAKENKIYVVSHLLENVRCQDKTEVIKSNLAFDRRGTVVSVYRKPLDPAASCNATTVETSSFMTDFGVTFGVLMPEDLVLRNLADLGVKNFVVAGDWESEIPVLAAPQFYTTWAFTTNANLVSSSGVFAGKAGQIGQGTEFVAAELNKDGEGSANAPIVSTSRHPEDLSRYTVKPLDLVASSQGVQETVCHGQFCCQFYVKTSSGLKSGNYGLAAFEGVRHFGGQHNIGTQHCALLPCVGASSCDIGSINNTKVIFDEVTITGNFKLKNSAQFPIILSTDALSNSEFQFDNKCQNNTNQVTIKMHNGQNLLNFGIFGRDFSKDNMEKSVMYDNIDNNGGLTYKIYEYINIINSEEVLDFCDYLWVRLRVLIFVVSIYVLEMM